MKIQYQEYTPVAAEPPLQLAKDLEVSLHLINRQQMNRLLIRRVVGARFFLINFRLRPLLLFLPSKVRKMMPAGDRSGTPSTTLGISLISIKP